MVVDGSGGDGRSSLPREVGECGVAAELGHRVDLVAIRAARLGLAAPHVERIDPADHRDPERILLLQCAQLVHQLKVFALEVVGSHSSGCLVRVNSLFLSEHGAQLCLELLPQRFVFRALVA